MSQLVLRRQRRAERNVPVALGVLEPAVGDGRTVHRDDHGLPVALDVRRAAVWHRDDRRAVGPGWVRRAHRRGGRASRGQQRGEHAKNDQERQGGRASAARASGHETLTRTCATRFTNPAAKLRHHAAGWSRAGFEARFARSRFEPRTVQRASGFRGSLRRTQPAPAAMSSASATRVRTPAPVPPFGV